jgi:DNA processing protein
MARGLGHDLAARGVGVASGLAFGIDAGAHEGALAGGGMTIAVLAGGLDSVYPAHHQGLADRIIASGGAILSEYPPGTPTYPNRFLERNRLVSGISRAVIVVEAPLRSGALATAHFALDQNRDVFAVPGPAMHRQYAGCHDLIKRGAGLLTTLDDLGDILPPSHQRQKPSFTNDHEQKIYEILDTNTTPLDLDTIAERSRLEPHLIQRSLSRLVIGGFVRENKGTYALADRHHENTYHC